MSGKRLQLKRGTTARTSTFTGLNGEVTVDTDKDTLVVHDNVTAGGFPLARESALNSHTARIDNPHVVTKAQVGLSNADNTADANKVVASAGKLTTGRTISLSGDVTGSVNFDGSSNADIVVTVGNDTHTHAFGNLTSKPTTLAGYGITDALGVNAKAIDSDKLDGLDSSAFVMKSTDNTMTGSLIFNNGTTDSNGLIFISNVANKDLAIDMYNGTFRFFRSGGTQGGLTPLSIGTDNNIYSDNGVDAVGRVLTTASGKAVDSDKLDGMNPTTGTNGNSIVQRASDGSITGTFLQSIAPVNSWKFFRLSDGTNVKWDIASIENGEGGSLRFRTGEGADRFFILPDGKTVTTNTMYLQQGASLRERGTSKEILYHSGELLNIGHEFSDVRINNQKAWHAGNDGKDSGLDADKLDGLDSTSFIRSDADMNATGRTVYTRNTPAINGSSFLQGAIELRTTDGSNPILGFHRAGYSACALYENGGQLYTRNNSNQEGIVYTSANLAVSASSLANSVVFRNGSGNFNANDIGLNGALFLPPNIGSIRTNTGLDLLWHNNDYMTLGYGMNYLRTYRPFVLNDSSAVSPAVIMYSNGYSAWEMDVSNGWFRLRTTNSGDNREIIKITPSTPTPNESYKFVVPSVYNNTSSTGIAVVVDGDGGIRRQMSSIKYKTNVEDIYKEAVDTFFANARPIYYKDKHPQEGKDWGYWGFIAEEVAEFDKRLVHYGYSGTKEEVVKKATYYTEDDELPEGKEVGDEKTPDVISEVIDTSSPLIPEGIMYDRITVLLTAKVQEQDKEIKSLRSELDELKLIVKGLIG